MHLTLRELFAQPINLVGDYLIEARSRKLTGRLSSVSKLVESEPLPARLADANSHGELGGTPALTSRSQPLSVRSLL